MKRKPEFEYKRSFSYKFNKWLKGDYDPYIGKVEMKPQHIRKTDDETIHERMRERNMIHEQIYEPGNNKILINFEKIYKLVFYIFCVFLLILLIWNVSYLPPVGMEDKAVNNEVPKRYIENGVEETGAVNFVTGMILDYRAFDTLGESNVLFCATMTVLILLKITDKTKLDSEDDIRFEPLDDPILKMSATVLVPVILLFGIYVILNGHLSPGGGFSGGAIVGAGLILYQNAFGFKHANKLFNEKTYKAVSATALLTYCICKMYSFFTGANHLDSHIPLGSPGAILSSGLILVLNICVGMVVACTMYTFYVMFRRGDF